MNIKSIWPCFYCFKIAIDWTISVLKSFGYTIYTFSFQHQAVQEMFNCWVWRIPPLRYLGGSQLEQTESSWDTESTFYIEISLQFKLFEIINRQWWKLLQDWVSTLYNWHSKRNFMIWILSFRILSKNREFNYVVLIDIIHLSL